MAVREKKHSYLDSTAYRSWVKKRDRALEKIHIAAQLKASDEMRNALGQVLLQCKAQFHQLKVDHNSMDHLDHAIRMQFQELVGHLFKIMMDLRVGSFILATASEAEIIARVNKTKDVSLNINREKLNKVRSAAAMAGGESVKRLRMYLDRIRRKILSQAQTASMSADTVEDFLRSVVYAFPKRRRMSRPKRILKPQLMEAEPRFEIGTGVDDWLKKYNQMRDQGASADEATFMLDQDAEVAWAEMLSAYKSEFIPKWREPEYIVDIPIADPTIQATTGEGVWYAWEFERDMTNEFVQSVRDGQVDAAKENGITDFVWIAVVDSVTDACCLWRDGLLVSEIEEHLKAHRGEDAECGIDGNELVPPLHFNCRCSLAPATDSIPDKPDTGQADFETWLAN